MDFERIPGDWELKNEYPFKCPSCHASGKIKPSMAMLFSRENVGLATCEKCNTGLLFRLDESNEQMVTTIFSC